MVGRWQLVARGLTRHQISDRLASGHLIAVHRGVYAVGHRAVGARTRSFAAALAVGRDAVISHHAAAAELDLRAYRGSIVDVTAPRRVRARQGVRTHQAYLTRLDVTRVAGLPATAWPRTALDLAPLISVRDLTRLLERADTLGFLDDRALDDVCVRARGHHGIPGLIRAREAYDPRHVDTRSDFERDALPLVDALGLPRPEINAPLGDYVVDLYWRLERVVLELDSWEHHRHRTAFEDDRTRDRWLAAQGLVCLRMTWRQLHAGALADIAEVLAARRVMTA